MNCPKCYAEILEKSKFCPECGTAVSVESRASRQEQDRSIGDLKTMQGGGRDGRAETSISEEAPLTARYELMEEIGEGGFAKVWKARDRKLGRLVAVKRLLAERLQGSSGELALARFRREAQAIAQLKHRNIVEVYDVGQDAGVDYMVMELVEGGSLRDLLKQPGLIPEAQAIELIRGIARGLAYAHKKNLVHRDIKPANILLANEGGETIPKIVDLGLARAGSDSELSVSGYGMGTPFYMPPEQRRDAKNVNHTADIYALGKTFYEMLTEEVPDQVDPDKVPPHLAKIILRCVKNNPEERYFSADEMIADLDAALGNRKPAVPVSGGSQGGGSACISCGAENPPGVEFCESCGAGLARNCPECGRKSAMDKKFCGGCGTDVAGFLSYAETLSRMEQFRDKRQWSRVEKEYDLLTKGIRLPGAAGRSLAQKIEALHAEAVSASAKVEDEQLPQEEKAVAVRKVEAGTENAEQPNSVLKWYLHALKKYAVFSGRASRKEYWSFTLCSTLVWLVGLAYEDGFLAAWYMLAVMLPSLAVTVRRLHDTGRRGAWVLVPLIWLVFMILDSKPGPNKYGPNPKGM